MRLTIINQFYPPDLAPTAHMAASLAEHRAAKGDIVTVIASNGSYVRHTEHQPSGSKRLRIERVWTPRLGKGRSVHRLLDYACFYMGVAARLLTMRAQDVVIALTTPPFIAGAAVLHRKVHSRCQVVLWNMDCYPEVPERFGFIRRDGLMSHMLRSLNRFVYRRVRALVYLDRAMADLCDRYLPWCRPPHVDVIANWEREELFPSKLVESRSVKQRRCSFEDPLSLLYLGNTGYGHSFETVVEAAAALRSEPVHFRFIGGGKRWNWLEEQRRTHRLENMTLEGYIPKERTPEVMSNADASLITLHDESLGVMSPSKLHSNLAAGLPVVYVGPEQSNVDDAIRRFECGISLRNGDAQGFAGVVRRMIAEPDWLTQLSRNARLAFEEAYSDRIALPQFDRILDSIKLPSRRAGLHHYNVVDANPFQPDQFDLTTAETDEARDFLPKPWGLHQLDYLNRSALDPIEQVQ